MHLKFKPFSTLRNLALALLLSSTVSGFAQIDHHEVGDMGYLRTPMETANGIIITNNRYSEIYSLQNNQLTPILQGRNCGLYTNLSKDGKYLGFKSFNDYDEQAPAILDVTTGLVTVLEDYVWECGQVSFANDGTMAYTMGNNLIIRKGNTRKAFDLGFYTNIANISPDGTQVAYSNDSGRMFIINTTTGAKENVAVSDGYRAIWSPDGTKMAVHITNGTLAVEDRLSKKVYNLGEGESATWANNSEELIFTKINRVNEMQVSGSVIKKINFDGTGEITLVNSSDNMPTDAIITTDNKLIVPYKTGLKRGLAVKNLVNGITPSAASVKEETVITIDEEEMFGARLGNPNDNPNIKPSIVPAEGTIGALDIPYLSQIYDSPSINGCTSYGYVTCAPTSASMYLGYFGLLNKVATTSRYDGTTKYYAYHVGKSYTNQAGTYTFSRTSYKNCAYVAGGYGFMWYGSNSPRSTFVEYMTKNGCKSSVMQWSASSSRSTFSTEAKAGRPILLCIALESSGHLILGFRNNCTYTTAGGFVTRTGSFVCHDPYGDDNDTYWADGDGQHSSYDWIGYNSGRANIGTFYYSCTAVPPTEAVTPKLTCNPTSITLEGEVGSTDNIYTDVKVTGEYLSTALAVASATSAITVTKLSGWDDLKGGTLRLTLNTNFSKGAGTYESYVAVQSTSSYRVQIATKVTLTGGTTDPSQGSTTDVISSLSEKWNYSQTSGKTADWITYGSQVTQDMAFKSGKLYVVDKTAAAIYIVDAYAGTKKGALNTSACTSGAHTLSAVEPLGNSIIACNLSNNASTNFKIYKWTSDDAEPTVMLDAALPAARLGDAMSVSGNETDGKIWFVNGSNVYYYTVKNGAITSTTPTTIALTKDGAAFATTSSYANVTVESDGSFWVAASNLATAHFSSTGAYIESLSLADNQGTDYKSFTLGNKKYAIATSYLKLAIPTGQTSATLADGAFTLLDITNGISSATTIGTYPSAGVGNVRNTSFRNSLCYEVTSTHVNAWILVPMQGAAYYSFQHTVPGTSAGTAVLTPAQTSATLECNTGETTYIDINVTGSDLHSNLGITSDSDAFSVTDNTTYNSADLTLSGSIRILFKPKADGVHNGTITLSADDSNGTSATATITVTGVANNAEGIENENVTGLTEVWNFSQATNNTGGWAGYGESDGIFAPRMCDMTFKDGKLYVIANETENSSTTNKILIIDAYTGAKTGELNTASCTEGGYNLSAIQTLGSSILACNMAYATGKLIIYKWDSDDAEPTVFMETTDHNSQQVGYAMTATGTMEDGKLWFVYNSTAYYYLITNGVCSTTPTNISLIKKTTDSATGETTDEECNISEGSYASHITIEEDESFWISSKEYVPTHFTAEGFYVEEMNLSALGNKAGTDLEVIKLGSKEYVAATTYLNTSATTLANGAFAFVDVTNGITSATEAIGTYPEAGLGVARRNQSYRTALCSEVTKNNLNVWVLISMQGIAHYKFQHSTVGIEDVVVDETADPNAPIEYYNLQGMKVVNPTGGIFIKVQGNKVSKVYVK